MALQNINDSVVKNRILDEYTEAQGRDHENEYEYAYVPSNFPLTKCSHNIVAYIAGFVVSRLKTFLHCETCLDALTATADASPRLSLIKLKTKGKLVFPSDDVIDICITCEKEIRQLMAMKKHLGKADFPKLLISVLAKYRHKEIFSKLTRHMYDTEPLQNHLFLLVKAVTEKYLHVRLCYIGKQLTAKIKSQVSGKSRQIYTKLIHFSGQ